MSDDPNWVAYSALALSVVSTLRPEIETAYYRFVKPIKPTIEQLPQVIVGINNMGPYLRASGVISVSHGSVLVRRMNVALQRDDSPVTAPFKTQMYVGTHGDAATNSFDMGLPVAFSVDCEKPYPFSAVFVSKPDAKVFERAMQSLQDDLANFSNGQTAQPTFPGQYAPMQDPWPAFRKSAAYQSCVDLLSRHTFWQAGDYCFTVSLETDGTAPGHNALRFTLTEQDVRRMVASIPRIPDSTFGYGDPRTAWTSLTLDAAPPT